MTGRNTIFRIIFRLFKQFIAFILLSIGSRKKRHCLTLNHQYAEYFFRNFIHNLYSLGFEPTEVDQWISKTEVQ